MKFKEIDVKGKINEEMSVEELIDVVVEEVKSAIKEDEVKEETNVEEDIRTFVNFEEPILEEIQRVQEEFADYGNETDCIFTKGNYSLLCDQLRYLHMLGHTQIIKEQEVKDIFRFLMVTFGHIQEEE